MGKRGAASVSLANRLLRCCGEISASARESTLDHPKNTVQTYRMLNVYIFYVLDMVDGRQLILQPPALFGLAKVANFLIARHPFRGEQLTLHPCCSAVTLLFVIVSKIQI